MIDFQDCFPICFMDEVNPDGRASPDAWVVRREGGVFVLDGEDGLNGEDVPLADGQIVYFAHLELHGTAVVSKDEEGNWTSTAAMPAKAQMVWFPHDPESLGYRLDDIADLLSPGESDEVQFYSFPKKGFVFRAATGRFEDVLPESHHD